MPLPSSALAVKGLKDICIFRMSLQASSTHCRDLLVGRANSIVRTALRCTALCWITKYVKYAARVTLKLCVELLMRVVCCTFDCRRFVAF